MQYFSVTEAAKYLGLNPRAVRARIERGQIAAQRLGPRVWAIAEDEVERWHALGRQRPGPKPGTSAKDRIILALAAHLGRRIGRDDRECHEAGYGRWLARWHELQADTPGLREEADSGPAARAFGEAYCSVLPGTRSVASSRRVAAPPRSEADSR